MERSFLFAGNICSRIALIFSIVCAPLQISCNECQCYFCEEQGEDLNHEIFNQLDEAFRQFEYEVENSENDELHTKGFLGKWCKKLKKWFKKKAYHLFKKIAGVKKLKTKEDCAYAIAKFKRKIDKKLYNTGKIDKIFEKFDEKFEKNHQMNDFKDRIKFYHQNKDAVPEHHQERFDDVNAQMKDVPISILVGGVTFYCGAVVAMIPFPGCPLLGGIMMGCGAELMYNSWANDFSEKQEELRNKDK